MKKSKNRLADILTHIGVAIVIIVALLPVVWLLMTSFKKPVDVYAMPPKIVFNPTVENYVTLFVERNFLHYLNNSIVVSFFATFICVFLGALVSYVLSRYRIKKKENIAFWFLSLRMLPPIAVILPYYLLFRNLGLLDSRIALVLVDITITLPFSVWMMKGFFEEVPIEYEEAAMVDGCTRFQAFLRIILPLVRPGLAATAVFSLIFTWNEFLFALILSGEGAKTLPVGVTGFVTFEGIKWGLLAAGGVFIIAPILIASLFIQKNLIRGLTFGGIK
ncbi:carbohydrate ABC transporter permease [Atribacter laminatus]|uniref:Inner membrane ABC transporter permease protein YcjP n=1 Tax=Atribacter laminatus TaxID=2847778 RepID=A0A7T1F3L8_ATRLM|nr:carbohydrate ABC transporter permease [Atribacter laminatus]QPM69002.1 Inner membrane ABC transporter permease protein YcjP [Atribacter laminatus]